MLPIIDSTDYRGRGPARVADHKCIRAALRGVRLLGSVGGGGDYAAF